MIRGKAWGVPYGWGTIISSKYKQEIDLIQSASLQHVVRCCGKLKLEFSPESLILPGCSHSFLDREVDGNPVEERRLPNPLGGVKEMFLPWTLQKTHVEPWRTVTNGGNVVLGVASRAKEAL